MKINVQKNAVVLCGTVAHRALIEKLKQRGYHTILIDYLDHPPAKDAADEFIQKSALDEEIVYEIAREKKADLVIATNQAIANTVACVVSERLGLHAPCAGETARLIDSKKAMKDIMLQHHIPTARFSLIENAEAFTGEELTFPVVVKPSVSYGSKGVRRADTIERAKEYIRDAFSISRDGQVIVEEFCPGVELSIYCFVQDGQAYIIHSNQRFVCADGLGTMMQGYAMLYPARYSKKTAERIQSIANGIADAFHLNTTPLFLQVMANGDDVKVLEFATRIGGGYSYRNVEQQTGFDYIGASINAYEGKKSDLSWHPAYTFSSTNHIYLKKGAVIGRYVIPDRLRDDHIVDEVICNKLVGESAQATSSTSGRVMTVLISAETYPLLLKKIEMAMDEIDILDTDGSSVMLKGLYIQDQHYKSQEESEEN